MSKMSGDAPHSNSLYVFQGELSILLHSMRRNFKWPSHLHQEPEQDTLVTNLNRLRDQLNQSSSLSQVDLMTLMRPFLDVIRSEATTGPVTELALSGIFKFLSYELIDPNNESAAITVESIADSVTHARFVGTDSGHDEVVLMKILQVLRMLVVSRAGYLLSNESICEIMQSCFRICFETRLSDLLRKSAEHSLSEMIRMLYSRLEQFPLQETKGLINYEKLKMRTASYDPSLNVKKPRSSQSRPRTLPVNTDTVSKAAVETPSNTCFEGSPSAEELPPTGVVDSLQVVGVSKDGNMHDYETSSTAFDQPGGGEQPNVDSDANAVCADLVTAQVESMVQVSPHGSDSALSDTSKDYVNSQGVRFVVADVSNEEKGRVHIPYGLPCVRELARFLISLINPLERQNSDSMIHVGLRLITVAVETCADVLVTVPSLLVLVQDETCRHLFSLMNFTDKLTLLSAACRLCFLLFESARTRLKFQLEVYVTKLLEIIGQEPAKVAFESRVVALEAIAQLLRIPGLATELFLNYDCDCHASNLFEELVKQLSKNVFPVTGIYATHMLSLQNLLIVVDCIEAHCLHQLGHQTSGDECESGLKPCNSVGLPPAARVNRFESATEEIPTHDQVCAIRTKKRLLISGADQFNIKPAKGIQFLQDNGVLSDPVDPQQIVHMLRENPRFDKKQIGEYISNRKNLDILQAFVQSLNFRSVRLDEALRLYLETFRLPGEAPVISLLMEHFAEHWHKSNDEPFGNSDAAFTLAYAVIMLNVDQHNQNVKRQNIPMTIDAFKRNLSRVNAGQDFDQQMLEDIYYAIRSEEIVMPAEQTGLVKENYMWKVLLRRGATKDGVFLHPPNGIYNCELFMLCWGPTVAALSFILEKSSEISHVETVLQSFSKISNIADNFATIEIFDHVIVTLAKHTSLISTTATGDTWLYQAVKFGNNVKGQLVTCAIFDLVRTHGNILRDGWRQIVDCVQQFYRLKILPESLVETEDLLDPNTKIKLICEETPAQRPETSIFSSLYSYIALSDAPSAKGSSPEDQEAIALAKKCAMDCGIEQLVADSKFLQTDALHELMKVLVASNDIGISTAQEHLTVFILELIIRTTVQNRDRVTCVWNKVRDHIYSLMMGAAAAEHNFVLGRSIVGLLCLTGRLMRREDVAPIVLQSLRMLLVLKPMVLSRVSRQIAYGLHELLKTGAANIHTTGDWRVIFTLLECVGAGAKPPIVRSETTATPKFAESITLTTSLPFRDNGTVSERGYTSDSELYEGRSSVTRAATRGSSPQLNSVTSAGGSGYMIVGPEGVEHLKGKKVPGSEYNIVHDRELLEHDPLAFLKSCESLSFLIRDVAHITPENFESAVQCIRTFVEASLNGGFHSERKKVATDLDKRGRSASVRRAEDRNNSFYPAKSASTSSTLTEDRDFDNVPSNYHQVPVQLLDLMHTLHTRAAQIYQWWASESQEFDSVQHLQKLNSSLWMRGWCPLLQGIARLCCDSRKQVRMTAITYLQRSLLVHDLQNLTAFEWESCFNTVLFPLLSKLLESDDRNGPDHGEWEETLMRASTVLSKVFLQHLGPLLQLSTFTALWLTLLDFMDKYMHAAHNDLAEHVPETVKNMLLVMETAGAFGTVQVEPSTLWSITWDRIDTFLPGLRHEVSRSRTPVARVQPSAEATPVTDQQVDPLSNNPTSTVSENDQKLMVLSTSPTDGTQFGRNFVDGCRDEGQQADEIYKVDHPDLKDLLPQPSDQQHSGGRVEKPNSSVEPPDNETKEDRDSNSPLLESHATDYHVAGTTRGTSSELGTSAPAENFGEDDFDVRPSTEYDAKNTTKENSLTSLALEMPPLPIPLPVSGKEASQAALWSDDLPASLPIFSTTSVADQQPFDDTSNGKPSVSPSHLPLLIASEAICNSLPIPILTTINTEEESF